MSAVLRAEGLRVRHGGVVALDRVDMEVPEGAIIGLIGPNGAGKTTFIDAVTGFTRPAGGRVLLDGRDITRLTPRRRAARGMSRTFQSGELFEDLTVRDHLTLAAHVPSLTTTITDFLRPARVLPDMDRVLDRLGISDLADRVPSDLSHGERQMVALARALAPSPRLVVLDEPAAGLGPDGTTRLAELIRDLPGSGTSVLLVDHDMSLVMAVCDRIDVLDFGEMIASGTPESIRNDAHVLQAYLGGGS